MNEFGGTVDMNNLMGKSTSSNKYTLSNNQSIKSGISIINFDPKNVLKDIYHDAIFEVVRVHKKRTKDNRPYLMFEAVGVTDKFNLFWFENGECQEPNSYIAKLVSCDIQKRGSSWTAVNEPVILQQETILEEDYVRAVEYLKVQSKSIKQLDDFLTEINYYDLMSNPAYKLSVQRLALQVTAVDDIIPNFPLASRAAIISALFMSSLDVVATNDGFEEDFVVYANIYSAHWKGESIAKYFVSASKTFDLNSHIIKMAKDIADNIILGGSLIC